MKITAIFELASDLLNFGDDAVRVLSELFSLIFLES